MIELESRASNWKERCFKMEDHLPKAEKSGFPSMKEDTYGFHESQTSIPFKPRHDWDESRPRINEGFLKSAVNRHISPRGVRISRLLVFYLNAINLKISFLNTQPRVDGTPRMD